MWHNNVRAGVCTQIEKRIGEILCIGMIYIDRYSKFLTELFGCSDVIEVSVRQQYFFRYAIGC